MSGTFNAKGQLEPSAAAIISIFGPKGSGKSVVACVYAMAWPYDMVVIDVAGDDGPDPRPRDQPGTHDVTDVTGTVDELPASWPEVRRQGKRPMILRYKPDAGSSTFLQDIDAMVGLAYHHSQKEGPQAMLLVHEIGQVARSNQTQPNMRRVLQHSRHRGLTCVFCGPRPITVDPLVIAQADLVYTFSVPQPGDRRHIAGNIGWDPGDFDAAVIALGRHEHLRFDAREPKPEQDGDTDHRLVHMNALPESTVRAALAWAHPEQK